MTPPARRAADRAGMPVQDRVRWHAFRVGRALKAACRFARRGIVIAWTILAVALATYAVFQTTSNGSEADARDEARKYQACRQRGAAVQQQNTIAAVTRSSLLTSRRRLLLQATRTNDEVLRKRYRSNAAFAKKRRARLKVSPVPDCERQYPEGRRQSAQFPDLAKQLPPRDSQGPRPTS